MTNTDLRVAYVCTDPGVPVFGNKGCSVHVQEILRAMRHRGFGVTLLASRLGGMAPEGLEELAVIELPRLPRQDDPKFLAAVKTLSEATTRALAGLPAIDLIYERYSLWSYAAMEYGSLNRITTFLEVNAPLIYEQETYREIHHRGVACDLTNRAYGAADSILAVSNPLKQMLLAEHPNLRNVNVVANGVDTQRFCPNLKSMRVHEAERLTFGFSGTLKPWHGVEDLLQAFAVNARLFPAHQLIIIGDGPQREMLEKQIVAQQLSDQVTITGLIDSKVMPSQLAQIDVAIAPYPRLPNMYFSPLKIFEYMAMGLCTVASSAGDIATIIDNEVTGLIYPAGNIQQLAACFSRLASDPGLITMLGSNARNKAQAQFSWDNVLAKSLRTV